MKISDYVEALGEIAFFLNRSERRRKTHKRKTPKVRMSTGCETKPKYYTEDRSPQTDRRKRRREKNSLDVRQLREED